MNGWKKAVTTAAVATSLTATIGALAATNDIFIKFEGGSVAIKGESQDRKHAGEIDVISWSWGVSQPAMAQHQGGGGGAGKVQVHDISIVKRIDKSSPSLFLASAEGRPLASATLIVRKAGGEQFEYLKIKLTDVFVASVQNAVKGDEAVEHLTLNFGAVEYEYTPQKPDGRADSPVKFGWDFRKNQQK